MNDRKRKYFISDTITALTRRRRGRNYGTDEVITCNKCCGGPLSDQHHASVGRGGSVIKTPASQTTESWFESHAVVSDLKQSRRFYAAPVHYLCERVAFYRHWVCETSSRFNCGVAEGFTAMLKWCLIEQVCQEVTCKAVCAVPWTEYCAI